MYGRLVNPATSSCPSCGATLQASASTSVCAFCRTTLVAAPAAGATGGIDRIVPFRVDEAAVRRRVQAWRAAQRLAPSAVLGAPFDAAAVFVPFHVFDGSVRTTFSGRVGVRYTTGSGKRRSHHTEWFPESGSCASRRRDHLVSASKGLSESRSNALEPFDLGQEVPWTPALGAGTHLEVRSIEAGDAEKIARTELERLGAEDLERLLGRMRLDPASEVRHEVTLEPRGTVGLPVWIVRIAVPGAPIWLHCNGQTGEVVGDLRVSGWKVFGVTTAGTAAVLTALAAVIGSLAALIAFFAGVPVLFGLLASLVAVVGPLVAR